MKCYRHPGKDAIGICKNCNKGLCDKCASDVGDGLACKNVCEQAVKDLNALIQKIRGITGKNSQTYYLSAVIYALFGSFFIFYPLFFAQDLSVSSYRLV